MSIKLNQQQRELVKRFGQHISDTGGNDIIELVEREGVNFFNNVIVSSMQIAVEAQIVLLGKLDKAGLLK